LFYAAGDHEMSFLGAEMCRYGGLFCDHPHDVLAAAGLAAAWNTFVGVADLQLKTENQATGPGRGPDIFLWSDYAGDFVRRAKSDAGPVRLDLPQQTFPLPAHLIPTARFDRLRSNGRSHN
jgi:hypothetical protein